LDVALDPLEGEVIVTLGGAPLVTVTWAEQEADRGPSVANAITDPSPAVVALRMPLAAIVPMVPVTDHDAPRASSVVPFHPLTAKACRVPTWTATTSGRTVQRSRAGLFATL
jgi:hypothetical protein